MQCPGRASSAGMRPCLWASPSVSPYRRTVKTASGATGTADPSLHLAGARKIEHVVPVRGDAKGDSLPRQAADRTHNTPNIHSGRSESGHSTVGPPTITAGLCAVI